MIKEPGSMIECAVNDRTEGTGIVVELNHAYRSER